MLYKRTKINIPVSKAEERNEVKRTEAETET